MAEVQHLSNLAHCHIVQVIGTYTMGHNLSILIYPVAEYNLETFLQNLSNYSYERTKPRVNALIASFRCLANALEYVHAKITKHMDIKPRNILVRDVRKGSIRYDMSHKVYIADFGISRSYASIADAETEGPTMFTRKYAAPEVVDKGRRGLAADIFSLGCVFAEIIAQLQWHAGPIEVTQLDNLLQLNEVGDYSYQANIPALQKWLAGLDTISLPSNWFPINLVCLVVSRMLEEDPVKRPTAQELAELFGVPDQCCFGLSGSEPLEAIPKKRRRSKKTLMSE